MGFCDQFIFTDVMIEKYVLIGVHGGGIIFRLSNSNKVLCLDEQMQSIMILLEIGQKPIEFNF